MENDTMSDGVNMSVLSSVDLNENVTWKYCSPEYKSFLSNFPPNEHINTINFIIGCFGFITNFLCVLVFFRKSMRSPTNLILAGIAFADLVVMSTLISKGIRETHYVRHNYPFFYGSMEIAGRVLFQVFHCISVWTAMLLSIWRYVAIVHPLKSRSFCTTGRARWSLGTIFVIIACLNFPEYMQLKLVASDPNKGPSEGGCGAPYCYSWTDFTKENFQTIKQYTQWYQALVGGQIIPCIILTIISIRLVIALLFAQKNRRRMGSAHKDKGQETGGKFDRTAKMLLVVLLIFVLTESPVGAFNICGLVLSTEFFTECYLPINYHLVTLNILSGLLNFFIYVVMSVNFRKTLWTQVLHSEWYCKKSRGRGVSTSQSSPTHVTIDSTV